MSIELETILYEKLILIVSSSMAERSLPTEALLLKFYNEIKLTKVLHV